MATFWELKSTSQAATAPEPSAAPGSRRCTTTAFKTEASILHAMSRFSSDSAASNAASAPTALPAVTVSTTRAPASAARNTGIKAASGEYIALLDGDDTWDPTFLEEQVRLIEDFPKAGLWGVNYAIVRSGIPYPCQQGMGAGFRGYVENYFGTKHNDLFCSSSVMIRKNVFEQVGYFDERIAASEDLDMWFRIILHFPIVYYDKVLVYYQQDAENRVAYDTGVRVPLTRDIRYYIDKFDADCDSDPTFSHYLHTYVAVHLLRKEYYFGTAKERKDSDVVVRKLRYEDIHPKYSWIFKTPRWFGRIVYKIVCMKKKVL